MSQLECHTHASEIFIRIVAATLVRVEHSESWRRSFILIWQVMICDYYINASFMRPMERLVRSYAAINADNDAVIFCLCLLKRGLLYAVAFRKAMRNVITSPCS